ATGIIIQTEENNLYLYPNPGTGLFYLETGGQQIDVLKIVSIEGAVVREIIPETGAHTIEIDMTDLNARMVFLTAYLKDQQIVKRAFIIR
ncbi:MAG: hypothetical protein U9R49_10490, partial [Bacteroidota bacterium]|nr:hypothetical protein [Bacteroidota bacterium]